MWKIVKYIAIASLLGLIVWGFKFVVAGGDEFKLNNDWGIVKDPPIRR